MSFFFSKFESLPVNEFRQGFNLRIIFYKNKFFLITSYLAFIKKNILYTSFIMTKLSSSLRSRCNDYNRSYPWLKFRSLDNNTMLVFYEKDKESSCGTGIWANERTINDIKISYLKQHPTNSGHERHLTNYRGGT